MIKYKVICRRSADECDINGDFVEIETDHHIYETFERALNVLHNFQDDPRYSGYSFYIKEVEDV